MGKLSALGFAFVHDIRRYWRFLLFLAMAAFEGSLLLAPVEGDSLALKFISYVLFLTGKTTAQKIHVLREIITNVFLAMSHIGPVLFPAKRLDVTEGLQALETSIGEFSRDFRFDFLNSFKPFESNPALQQRLLQRMQKNYAETILFSRNDDFRRVYTSRHAEEDKKTK